MRASTLFALTLSILVGLGVAIAAKMAGYFNPPPGPAPVAEAPKKAKEITVLAAGRNIFANDMIDPAFVKTRTLRPEEVEHYEKNKDLYLPAVPQAVFLRIAKTNILAEQPITKEQLKEMAKAEPLDARLMPQMRVVNIALPKDYSAGGLIQVGDWVDVTLTSSIEAPGAAPTTRTAIIAPRVRVIAKRNTLWPVFAPLADDKPISYTLEVNPYRQALIEYVRGKGQLILSPLPATDQRKLEAQRAEIMKNPAAGGKLQFISTDETEITAEEARVDNMVKGHGSVSELDMIRIFNLQTGAPPEVPPQLKEPVAIERIGGTQHRDPIYFHNDKIIAVGTKQVNKAPEPINPNGTAAGAAAHSHQSQQFKFAAPSECTTCKNQQLHNSKKTHQIPQTKKPAPK